MYKVLLVEDDKAMRFLYRKMKIWAETGFAIEDEASNGREALELLKKKKYDLIFTDIRMPFIDGIELLRRIKSEEYGGIVVFASSYNDFEYARQGIILGAFDYILKPFDEKQLEKVIGRVYEKLLLEKENKMLDDVVESVFVETGIEPSSDNFVYQCAEYFSENYRNLFTMEQMSEYLGYNKDYFGKLFKLKFGMTFHRFINILKVEYAKELISTGNYKTYEISEILGFSGVDYFTRIFKEVTGTTPSSYRNQK